MKQITLSEGEFKSLLDGVKHNANKTITRTN